MNQGSAYMCDLHGLRKLRDKLLFIVGWGEDMMLQDSVDLTEVRQLHLRDKSVWLDFERTV
jgi:hypothetical protein